jgi:hypothetical protein
MNIKLAALPILTIVVSTTISLQSANADPMSARFKYPVNYYKVETNHLPQDNSYAPVPSGPASVPHNSSFLAPQELLQSKAAVPQIAPMVTARVKPTASFTQAVPLNSPFKQSFGNPISPPQQVAALPKAATPLALPAQAKKLASASVPAKPIVASRNVSGHILNKHPQTGSSAGPALALKKVESYGNVGYIPGFTPTSTGSSASVSTTVAGTIIGRRSGR